MDKIGVGFDPITSGPLERPGQPVRWPFDEPKRAVFAASSTSSTESFVDVVTADREVSDPTTAFDGRVFTARQAQAIGLIDEVCDLDASLTRAAELADAEGATVVQYKRPLRLPRQHLRQRARSHDACCPSPWC